MSLISVTRLRVRALRYLPGFLFFALVSAREARRARGNRGADLLAEAKRTFWTSTAWEERGLDGAAREGFARREDGAEPEDGARVGHAPGRDRRDHLCHRAQATAGSMPRGTTLAS